MQESTELDSVVSTFQEHFLRHLLIKRLENLPIWQND